MLWVVFTSRPPEDSSPHKNGCPRTSCSIRKPSAGFVTIAHVWQEWQYGLLACTCTPFALQRVKIVGQDWDHNLAVTGLSSFGSIAGLLACPV